MNENCDIANSNELAFERVSLFHCADELYEILSKQLKIGKYKSVNASKASWRSIQRVRHNSFNFRLFSLGGTIWSIQLSKESCLSGELVKKNVKLNQQFPSYW